MANDPLGGLIRVHRMRHSHVGKDTLARLSIHSHRGVHINSHLGDEGTD